MQDQAKTKEQLLAELDALRERIAGMEKDRDELWLSREALKKSEEKLRVITAHVSDILFFQDQGLRYVWILNPADPLLESQVAGKTDADLLPAEEAALLSGIKREVLATGAGRRVELQLSPGGITRWYEALFEPSRDPDGRIVGLTSSCRDITERKRMENSLRQSEDMYRKIVETAEEGIWRVDREWRTDFVNARMEEMLGYRNGEMLGRHVWEFMDDEWRRIATVKMAGLQQGVRETFEFRFLRRDGRELWTLVSTSPLFSETGELTGSLAMISDISRYKLAEQALLHSERRFRAIYEQAPLGIALLDSLTGQFLEINSRYCDIAGRNREEMLHLDYRSITHPDDLPGQLDHMALLLKGEIDRFKIQKRYVRPGGSIVWANVTVVPLWEGAQVQRRHLVIVEDITEQIQSEKALQESEQRLRQITEAMREVFFLRTPDETLYVNPAYERIWGRSLQSLYVNPDSFLEAVHPEDRAWVEEACRRAFSTAGSLDQEHRILHSDGTVRWVHARTFPVTDPNGRPRTAGIVEDITVRKELETILRTERDIAIGISSAPSLIEALDVLLDACLSLDKMDSGGVYLVDAETGGLRLIRHKGLSPEFVDRVESYDPDSLEARLVFRGEPLYWPEALRLEETERFLEKEQIQVLASIPLKAGDTVIGALNVASRSRMEIPPKERMVYESIAHMTAAVVARMQMEDRLRVQAELLHETNAAMRALLRQREIDRIELERTITDNVRGLVMPYVEKLKRSRPTEHQRLYIELLESHLGEVVTPLLQRTKVSSLLTPSELRVAELIRQDRTSKEISEILGTSESTIHFHRKSIRRKLKLSHEKANLKSHLGNPENW